MLEPRAPLPFGLIEPRHPTGRELTDFERHLLRVRLIGHEANKLWCSALREDGRKNDSVLVFTLHNYALILICRFLEIWNEFNALAKHDPKVLEATRLCAPLLQRIRIWPGLIEYRNMVLAHQYRWNSRPELITPWAILHSGRVPVKPAEWFVLLDCVRSASACVTAYFGPVAIELEPVLAVGREPDIAKGVQSNDEAETARREMAIVMDGRMKEAGVDLSHPVFATMLCK